MTIPIFSPLWWQANIVTAVLIATIIFIGKRLSPKYRNRLAVILAVVLLSRWILYHPYVMWLGKWNVRSNLPLHMCGLSALLSGTVLIWRNQWAYEFLYYWGIPGAFHSLLTPEFTSGSEALLFQEYFVAHGGIIASALYLTLVLRMRPRKGSWWRVTLWTQPVLVVIGVVNWLLDANYMYLCEKPIANNPFVMGEWPWYLLGLEIAGLLHVLIIYSPFWLHYRRHS
ncbi:MAG: TIGR02206 family membrane protein [Candidatus Neomarinimicrobiota bacterium]